MREGTSISQQSHATAVICNLAQCKDTARILAAESDAVRTCVHVLGHASSTGSMLAAAAATLGCVSETGRRDSIIGEGGVQSLLPLLGRGDDGETHAARTLCSLAIDSGSHRALSEGLVAMVSMASSATSATSAGEFAPGRNDDRFTGWRLVASRLHSMRLRAHARECRCLCTG